MTARSSFKRCRESPEEPEKPPTAAKASGATTEMHLLHSAGVAARFRPAPSIAGQGSRRWPTRAGRFNSDIRRSRSRRRVDDERQAVREGAVLRQRLLHSYVENKLHPSQPESIGAPGSFRLRLGVFVPFVQILAL